MPKPNFKYRSVQLAILAAFALPGHAEEIQLQEVQVVGRSEGQRYYSDEAGVSRAETPLREMPQAVRVVPRQAIDVIGAVRLEEAYDYVSGVNRQNSFGGLWDNFSIRGFAGDPNTEF